MTIIRQIADTTEKQVKSAQKVARRSWLAGLGVAGLAIDSGEKTFKKLIKRGEKVAAGVRGDLKDLNTRLRREQKSLNEDVQDASQTVERGVSDVLEGLNIPSRKTLRVLDARIAQLNAQLRELGSDGSIAPVANYDSLTAEEIIVLMPSLSLDELFALEAYESNHAKRVTVQREIEQAIAKHLTVDGEIREPFAGYEALRAEEAIAKLEGLGIAELHHVKLFEASHAKRVTVQREVERRLEALRG